MYYRSIVFGGILFCDMRFLVRSGYARDAGTYVAPLVEGMLWLYLVICAAAFAAFFLIRRLKHEETAKKAAVILLALVVIGGLGANGAWQISFSRAADRDIEHEAGNIAAAFSGEDIVIQLSSYMTGVE